jgi:hypothetical protein
LACARSSVRELLEVELGEQVADRLRAHLGLEPDIRLLVHHLVELLLGDDLAPLEPGLARVDHDERLVVEDALEVTDAHVEQVADARRHALEEPDVRHRHRELDVAEPLAPHLGLRHLDAAAIADHAAVAMRLYLPQLHSQSFTGPKIFSQNSPSFSGLNER